MTHLPEAICWSLLHFLWQATAIALLYKHIQSSCRASSARARYTLALMTLLTMFGAAISTVVYEAVRLNSSVSVLTSNTLPSVVAVATPVATHLSWLNSLTHVPYEKLPLWLDSVWVAGVMLMSLRASGGAWLLALLRRSNGIAAPRELTLRISELSQRMNVKRRVSVRIHASVSSPFVVGIIRPVIYLPLSSVTGLAADQLEAILTHELAHVIRLDYLWNTVQIGMETLFFFHPAVWLLGAILREQRELCCDDMVLESSVSAKTYAAALLVVAQNGRGQFSLALSIDGHDPTMQLLSRVKRILGGAFHSRQDLRSSLLLRLSVPAIASLALLCGARALPSGQLASDQAASAVAQPPGSGSTDAENFRTCKRSETEPDVDAACLASAAENAARTQAPIIASEHASAVASHIESAVDTALVVTTTGSAAIRVLGTDMDVHALAGGAARAAVTDDNVHTLCMRIWSSLAVKPSGPRCAPANPPAPPRPARVTTTTN